MRISKMADIRLGMTSDISKPLKRRDTDFLHDLRGWDLSFSRNSSIRTSVGSAGSPEWNTLLSSIVISNVSYLTTYCQKAKLAENRSLNMIQMQIPASLNIRVTEGINPTCHAALITKPVTSPMNAGLCFWKHISAFADMANPSYILKIDYQINNRGDDRHRMLTFYEGRNKAAETTNQPILGGVSYSMRCPEIGAPGASVRAFFRAKDKGPGSCQRKLPGPSLP